MTKLLTQMSRADRENVATKLRQEAAYRVSIARDVAGDDKDLLAAAYTWLFGPAAYSIEDLHRQVVEERMEAAQR